MNISTNPQLKHLHLVSLRSCTPLLSLKAGIFLTVEKKKYLGEFVLTLYPSLPTSSLLCFNLRIRKKQVLYIFDGKLRAGYRTRETRTLVQTCPERKQRLKFTFIRNVQCRSLVRSILNFEIKKFAIDASV